MKTVDFSCDCGDCSRRADEFYLMETHCYNCKHEFLSKHRKGDKVSGGECPYCGCGGFSWDFAFHDPDEGDE